MKKKIIKNVLMGNKKRKTSVELTGLAQKIKNRYVHLGLKNLLSAGLVLFDKQTSSDKMTSLDVAFGLAKYDEFIVGKGRIDLIRKLKKIMEDINKSQVGMGQSTLDWKEFYTSINDLILEFFFFSEDGYGAIEDESAAALAGTIALHTQKKQNPLKSG